MSLTTNATVDLLCQQYVELFPTEAADVLQALPDEELLAESARLPIGSLIEIIDFLSPARTQLLFLELDSPKKVEVLLAAPPRVILKLLTTWNAEERANLLDVLDSGARKSIEAVLQFSPDSVAALMSSTAGTVYVEMTVNEAIEQIRIESTDIALTQLVVDQNNRLLGRVTTHALALTKGDARIREIMEPVNRFVNVTDSHNTVIKILEESDIDVLPVLDEEQKLLGVVTQNKLTSVIQQDTQADLQRMVGVSTEERALSTGIRSIKHRLPWLYINLFTAFLAAAVVGVFENLVAQFTALAVLLPVVAGQSGNAGSQAMAVAIRGLALREISFRQWFVLSRKELVVGLINGFLIAVVCGLAVFLWQQSIGLSLIISISMVLALAVAGISGALVPILLARFGQDPATSSSIILTTITDVVGFFVFLGIATLLASYI